MQWVRSCLARFAFQGRKLPLVLSLYVRGRLLKSVAATRFATFHVRPVQQLVLNWNAYVAIQDFCHCRRWMSHGV